MQVIYRKPILERLDETIAQAMIQRKQIEKIVLNKEEWKEFESDIRRRLYTCPETNLWFGVYDGVRIEQEEVK